MTALKITSWNIEHMSRLFETGGSAAAEARRARRRAAVADQVRELDADVLCVLEGPASAASMHAFCDQDLGGDWSVIEAADGNYGTRGSQWIWFLVRRPLADAASLLPIDTYKEFAGASWTVHYWGRFEEVSHRHYRHPQTLVLDWLGERIEFIGLHLKSKFVRSGRSDWAAGGERRQNFVRDAIKARIPDFAIVDFNLGMESSEPVARELKANGVRFVLATGYAEMGDQVAEFGAESLLSKPYGRSEIEELLVP